MASGSSEWQQECSLCDVKLASKAVALSHYSGSKHAKNVREKQQLKKDAKKPLVSAADYPTICELCNKRFSSPINAKEHFEGNGHKRRQSEHFADGNRVNKIVHAVQQTVQFRDPRTQHFQPHRRPYLLAAPYWPIPSLMHLNSSQENLFDRSRMLSSSLTSLNTSGIGRGMQHNHSSHHHHHPQRDINQTEEMIQATSRVSGQYRGRQRGRLRGRGRPWGRGRGGSTHKTDRDDGHCQCHTEDDASSEDRMSTDSRSYDEEVSDVENDEEDIRAIVQDILSKRGEDDVRSDLSDIIQQVKQMLELKRQQISPLVSSELELGSNDGEMKGRLFKNTNYEHGSDKTAQVRKKRVRPHQRKLKDKDLDEKNDASPDVDEFAVFQFVIKKYSGHCEVGQLRSDAQHLFPPGLDVLTWLFKSRSFKVFKRSDPSKLYESLVFVKKDRLRLCAHYVTDSNCSLPNCPYIHLCRSFLAGCCSGADCRFSHSLTNEHNLNVLKELHLSEIFTEAEILSVLRCCTLFVCSSWNKNGWCSISESYSPCPYLHVCQNFVLRDCTKVNCKLGHNLDTSASRLLLGPAFYGVNKLPTPLLLNVILLPNNKQEPIKMRQSVSKSESGQQRTEQPQERSIGLKEEKKGYRNDQLRENMTAKQKTTEKVDSWRDIHLYDDKEERFICEANLRKQCRYGAQMCTKHHYPLPYLWQIKVNDIWEVMTENSSIEAAYCDPNKDNYTYILEDSGSRRKVTIDFRTLNDTVRRLSTESYMEVPEVHDYHTVWIWYWQDNKHNWLPYEIDSLPYQDIIEAKYLAKEVAGFVEIAQFPYLLDLINMVQINTVTSKQRHIKRRPKLITAEEILLGSSKVRNYARHYDKAVLPFGWVPMNTQTYTTPDLVPVTEKSPNFAMVSDRFFSSMDQTQCKIHHIFRIQNLALWEKYVRKKREMQQSAHLKGNANEKSLFHGISNQEIVRCICREGFDWRVCGKHGTLYGNGSYFARDASYSNNYSIKNRSRKRQMFLSLVLVGAYTQGEQNLTRPPQLYNSCVDDMTDPNIYVIFHDDQSYPEYLIEYKLG